MIHQMGQLRASQHVEVLSGKCCAVLCCAAWHSLPLFNLRIRHSLGQSDTHSTSRAVSQPFSQSVSQSLAQSVNLAVHTPENSCQASECVVVVAAVVCVLHFMTVIHFCV